MCEWYFRLIVNINLNKKQEIGNVSKELKIR